MPGLMEKRNYRQNNIRGSVRMKAFAKPAPNMLPMPASRAKRNYIPNTSSGCVKPDGPAGSRRLLNAILNWQIVFEVRLRTTCAQKGEFWPTVTKCDLLDYA